jgi:hypothetical protein
MLPPRILSSKQRLDDRIQYLEEVLASIQHDAEAVDLAKMQYIAASYITVAASGLLETGIQAILYDFSSSQCSEKVGDYVHKKLKGAITLNCDKICALLGSFDAEWQRAFAKNTTHQQRAAINSLKTLRDDVTHGRNWSPRYTDVKTYYDSTVKALEVIHGIVR